MFAFVLRIVGWLLALFLTSPVHAQVATMVRSSGQVEVLSDPADKTGEGGTVLYEGKHYRSVKGRIGLRLKDGVIIKTGNESKATIIYQNGDMISLGADTFHHILPVTATDGKQVMEVLYGTVRSQITKDGPRAGMEVRTRTSVMGVRGTDFFVKRPGTSGDSELVVLRGEVAVAPTSAPMSTATPVKAGSTASTSADDKAVQVEPAKKETLIQVQKATAASPAIVESPKQAAELKQLEEKAAANILKDIKAHDPKLYERVLAAPAESAGTYALNTVAVENLYEQAPGEAPAAEDVKVVFAKTPPPEQPALIEPAVEASLSTGEDERRIDFVWKNSARSAKYELQVSSDAKFSSPQSQTLTETRHTLTLAPATWFWRVRGIDSEGREGLWSDARRFSIGRVLSPEERAKLAETPQEERPEESGSKVVSESDGPEPPPVDDTPQPAEPVGPRNLWVGLGLGGGSYEYTVRYDNVDDTHSDGGGGLSLAAAYRAGEQVELAFSVAQRSYEGLGEKDKVDVTLADLGARYFFPVADSFGLGVGLTYGQEGLPYPSLSGDLKVDTLEQLYAVVTLAPSDWPVMAWRAEIGYGLLGGAENFDVKDDKVLYVLGGYERQWFSFPLTLGAVMKISKRELTIREKNGLDGVLIKLERTDLMLRAGYSF